MKNKRNRFTCGLVAPGAISLSPNCICASVFDGDGGGDGSNGQSTKTKTKTTAPAKRAQFFDAYYSIFTNTCPAHTHTQHKSWTNHKLNAPLPCTERAHTNTRICREMRAKIRNEFFMNWNGKDAVRLSRIERVFFFRNHHPLVSCCQLLAFRWLLWVCTV